MKKEWLNNNGIWMQLESNSSVTTLLNVSGIWINVNAYEPKYQTNDAEIVKLIVPKVDLELTQYGAGIDKILYYRSLNSNQTLRIN